MLADEIYKKTQTLIKKSCTNNPFQIASDNNIMVRTSTDFKELKGLYTIIKRKRIIILNGNLSYEEQKLVCAHEIGHDFMHRDFARNKVLHEYVLYDMKAKTEYEANMFAADIMISDEDIIELACNCEYSISQIANALNTNADIVGIKISNMNSRGFNFNLGLFPKRNVFI